MPNFLVLPKAQLNCKAPGRWDALGRLLKVCAGKVKETAHEYYSQ